jgi:hypothetical protein
MFTKASCLASQVSLSMSPDVSMNSFKQCCGSGSVGIRIFLPDPNPLLEVSVSDPGPYQNLDVNINKNNQFHYVEITGVLKCH